MNLTRVERLILANQYEILALLKPTEAKHYDRRHEVVACGYTLEYEWIAEHVYAKELSVDDCKLVINAMAMHEALQRAETSDRTMFFGFDGNNESEFMAYARHFRADRRFESLKLGDDGLNSHMPTLARYRAMLEEWDASTDKNRLTSADVDRITSVKGF